MANTIRIKKRAASGSDGAPSSLASSELAFNESDLKLYYGFGDNGSGVATSIITIGGAGALFSKLMRELPTLFWLARQLGLTLTLRSAL